jgi:DNA polymerase III subunit beta
MQISFQRDELLKPLSFVAGVVERRQTLPILSYVLLRQDGQDVTLTGTDLEIEVVANAKCESRGSGELTLPARKLLDICRALPADAMVDIRKEGEKAVVKAGRSRFSLLTLPGSDFPSLEVGQWDVTFTVPQKKLKEALTQTHFCMAQQDVRYYLNGLLFETGGSHLRLVGTDGHRMALTEFEVRGDLKGERQVIVPRKGVQEMIRLLEDADTEVEVGFSGNHLQAKTTGFTFRSKLIDGRYPDYNKVLPSAQGKHAIVERESFRESLGRAAILSNEKYRGVRLNFQNKALKISAHNPEQEEAQEEIGLEYQGEMLEIGFNVNYLLEAVGALGGERIKLGLNDPNASCLLTVPDQVYPQYVIMPMRL